MSAAPGRWNKDAWALMGAVLWRFMREKRWGTAAELAFMMMLPSAKSVRQMARDLGVKDECVISMRKRLQTQGYITIHRLGRSNCHGSRVELTEKGHTVLHGKDAA